MCIDHGTVLRCVGRHGSLGVSTDQLAGDLLPDSTVREKVASAYNRLLPTSQEAGAQEGDYLARYAADRVRNLGSVWLGLTTGCAECHDHKYDPMTLTDFYELAAVFSDLDEMGVYMGLRNRPPEIEVPTKDQSLALNAMETKIEHLKESLRSELKRHRIKPKGEVEKGAFDAFEAVRTEEQRKVIIARYRKESEKLARYREQLDQLIDQRRTLGQEIRRCMVSVSVESRETRVLPRGNWMDRSGPVVTGRLPGFLGGDVLNSRRALADWLVSSENPMTARVVVNRLWRQFFGRGLVSTMDYFGLQGDEPSHPELLDWLAAELMDHNWDLQHVIRLIVGSRAYRLSSVPSELGSEAEERLVYRYQGRDHRLTDVSGHVIGKLLA